MSKPLGLIPPNEYHFDFSDSDTVRWGRCPITAERHTRNRFIRYHIDDREIAGRFGENLDPLLADWIDVAFSVYLADRFALRRGQAETRREAPWGRILRLRVPVRKPETWDRPEVMDALCGLLYYFTEDDWRFEFVNRRRPGRPAETQPFLFANPPPTPVRVALYSGGLDSFAGTIQQMMSFPKHSFVLVSGASHNRQRLGQRRQVAAIEEAHNCHIWRVAICYERSRDSGTDREEASQRTRGFLYLTLGGVTAIHIGCRELFVYENGIGAINLPCDGSQVGTAASRAVHPSSLFRMADFVTLLTGELFHIENPFLFSTKAEMCRHLAASELTPRIAETFSCDHFPIRKRNTPQCGSCTSCLLRRLSLQRAGLSRFDTQYVHDLCTGHQPSSRRHLMGLRAMEWQYSRISRALYQKEPWRGLVEEFPQLREVVDEMCRRKGANAMNLKSALVRLYSQHATEWESFSARNSLRTKAA